MKWWSEEWFVKRISNRQKIRRCRLEIPASMTASSATSPASGATFSDAFPVSTKTLLTLSATRWTSLWLTTASALMRSCPQRRPPVAAEIVACHKYHRVWDQTKEEFICFWFLQALQSTKNRVPFVPFKNRYLQSKLYAGLFSRIKNLNTHKKTAEKLRAVVKGAILVLLHL